MTKLKIQHNPHQVINLESDEEDRVKYGGFGVSSLSKRHKGTSVITRLQNTARDSPNNSSHSISKNLENKSRY